MSRRRSRTAATASVAAVQPQKSAKPAHGASVLSSRGIVQRASAAVLGRYGLIAFAQSVGSSPSSGGMTNRIATNATIAAGGVADDRADAEAEEPHHRQDQGGADHGPGDARREKGVCEDPANGSRGSPGHEERDQDRRQAEGEGDLAANTTALSHRTGSRLGTAQNVERIMPVEYSPVITSTPSTPIESSAKMTPRKLARNVWT